MRILRTLACLSLAVSFGLASPPGAWAFKTPTHRSVNLRAVDFWDTSRYLSDELGLREGTARIILDRAIRRWIEEGGAAEDQYLGDETLGALNRSKHHFHNPLRLWASAGLNARCFFLAVIEGSASVRWAQDPDQLTLTESTATWADARKHFWQMLSLSSKESDGENRDKATAELFRSLGQQMHLVADLAVPAHTRDDIHCTPRAEPFEI
jgi:hypothetical protein